MGLTRKNSVDKFITSLTNYFIEINYKITTKNHLRTAFSEEIGKNK